MLTPLPQIHTNNRQVISVPDPRAVGGNVVNDALRGGERVLDGFASKLESNNQQMALLRNERKLLDDDIGKLDEWIATLEQDAGSLDPKTAEAKRLRTLISSVRADRSELVNKVAAKNHEITRLGSSNEIDALHSQEASDAVSTFVKAISNIYATFFQSSKTAVDGCKA